MKKISLNINNANSVESFHIYLKDILELPDCYGKNLDALYDCLTSISEDVTIIIAPGLGGMLKGYGNRILKVFEDASAYNEHLHLQTQEEPKQGL